MKLSLVFYTLLLSFLTNVNHAWSCEENITINNKSIPYNYQKYDIKIPFRHHKIHTLLDGADFFSKPLEVIRFDNDIKPHPTHTTFNENGNTFMVERQRLIEPISLDIESNTSLPSLSAFVNESSKQKNERMVDNDKSFPVNIISEQRLIEPLTNNHPKKARIISPLYNNFSYSKYSDSLFIYPSQPEQDLKQKIHEYMHNYTSVSQLTDINKTMMNGKAVLKWSLLNGKSRFHFYMILGNNYHYLFMSSPYGNTESIERIINSSVVL